MSLGKETPHVIRHEYREVDEAMADEILRRVDQGVYDPATGFAREEGSTRPNGANYVRTPVSPQRQRRTESRYGDSLADMDASGSPDTLPPLSDAEQRAQALKNQTGRQLAQRSIAASLQDAASQDAGGDIRLQLAKARAKDEPSQTLWSQMRRGRNR